MKPFVIVPYLKQGFREIHVSTGRGRAYSAPSPTFPFSEDTGFTVNALYFCDNDSQAEALVTGLSLQYPQWNWLIAKISFLVDMPPLPAGTMPTFKHFTEKGVLP